MTMQIARQSLTNVQEIKVEVMSQPCGIFFFFARPVVQFSHDLGRDLWLRMQLVLWAPEEGELEIYTYEGFDPTHTRSLTLI